MVSQEKIDEEWLQQAEGESSAREAFMAARYTELAALPEDERRTRLRAMAQAEYSLPDDKLRPFTVSRMRTWLALDPAQAAVVAASYDAVMQEMPAPVAMRRVALVQTLAREFSLEDEERLRQLAPRVFAGTPSRTTGLDRPEPEPLAVAAAPKKAWWAFWRKG